MVFLPTLNAIGIHWRLRTSGKRMFRAVSTLEIIPFAEGRRELRGRTVAIPPTQTDAATRGIQDPQTIRQIVPCGYSLSFELKRHSSQKGGAASACNESVERGRIMPIKSSVTYEWGSSHLKRTCPKHRF